MLKQGKALVMFDGFDEVPPAKRAKVSEWLSGEMQQYHNAVFIVTSRPKAYKDDYVAEKPNASFWIQDFNQAQREQFIKQWYLCQERNAMVGKDPVEIESEALKGAKSLLDQIQERPELNDITENVLLLNMLARFHRDKKQGTKLPHRKVDLYQEICEMQLERRPTAKGVALLLNSINQRQEVLQFIALRMMLLATRNPANKEGFKEIQRDSLLEFIKKSLVNIDPNVDVLKLLAQMVDVSELLVKGDGSIYQFSHLSFQEFLAAKEIVSLKYESLLYEHLNLSVWRDMILFYTDLVYPTKFIKVAINRKETDLAYQIFRQADNRTDLPFSERQALISLKETVKAARALRYEELERYLKAKQWKEADRETIDLMLSAVGKESGQSLSSDNLQNFPCDEILEIDRLWIEHSHGLYGFSVQRRIYEECGGKLDFSLPSEKTWNEFCDLVAWKSWDYYESNYVVSLSKEFEGRRGYLPSGYGNIDEGHRLWCKRVGKAVDLSFCSVSSIVSRLATCTLERSKTER